MGNWNNFPNRGATDFHFYKDSIVSTENHFSRTGKWTANDSVLFLKFPKLHPDLRENIQLHYKSSNDSLWIKNDFDSIYTIPVLFKVTDSWKHFLHELNMNIELPSTDFTLIKNEAMPLGVNLFISIEKNHVIIRTNHRTIPLDITMHLESFIYSERAKRKPSEVDEMYFNLIIDKHINKSSIDSVKTLLKIFPKMKTFRVYENKVANYGTSDLKNAGQSWNWYGRFE